MAFADKLNKALFCAMIEDVPLAELPKLATGTFQVVNLASGRDHVMLPVVVPGSLDRRVATFSREGLARLKLGLAKTGLNSSYFRWPPSTDPRRPPYPGLRPLDVEDAGIFFGREAQIVEGLDRLRATRGAPGGRFLCLLGASGSGKSSFLRAGLWPRLARDDRTFLPLPVLRPERAAISGRWGLVAVLEAACESHGLLVPRAEIRAAVAVGIESLHPLLCKLTQSVSARRVPDEVDGIRLAAPLVVLPVDQGEELFLAEGAAEGGALLALLRDLVRVSDPDVAVLMAIRSDAFERLQLAPQLCTVRGEDPALIPQPMSFGPMPRGVFATVIEGPAVRMCEADRPLAIDPALTRALLDDIDAGGGRDALPLLAFTLERLWLDYGARGRLTLADYESLGRVRGSIEAAIEEVFRKADADDRIPRDRAARLTLLRRGFVPWLAGIDPDTNLPRRRVARRGEIPDEALALIDLLVEVRLLEADVDRNTGDPTLEPAHEALLRQWGLLQGWLEEDLGILAILEGVRRAARDWDANARKTDWLNHGGDRLHETSRLSARPDIYAQLGPIERDYLDACRETVKMGVIGQMTASVAHDFGAILATIQLATTILRRGGLTPRQRQVHIETIGETADRAVRLTSSITAFGLKELRKLDALNVVSVLNDLSLLLTRLLGTAIRLEVRTGDRPCFVMADVNELVQVVINLAVNAREAMASEGLLTIAVRRARHIPASGRHAAVSGGFVAIEVTDTGCGLTPEQIGHIEDGSPPSPDSRVGIDPGLYVIYGFAKPSLGHLRIVSQPGARTTFTLYLPSIGTSKK